MTAADGVLLVIILGLSAYLVLGGADFGGGIWDLLARGEHAPRQRALIARALGPIWEANHVWLIFALVATFSAFPPVYAAIGRGLTVPVGISLLGIVLRGAGYVYRAYGDGAAGPDRLWGHVFAIASTVTPYMLGVAAAGLATGQLHAGAGLLTQPFPILTGALSIAATAFLAAVYLAHEAHQHRDIELAALFRRRALAGAITTGALTLALAPTLPGAAPALAHHLPRALPFVALSAAAGLSTLLLLWRARYQTARVTAALAVAAVLWGWAAAQYPYLIGGELSLDQAATAPASVEITLTLLVAGLAILAPAVFILFRVFARPESLGPESPGGSL
jgi:cytochrome d ubiquinol oxidase subunit II